MNVISTGMSGIENIDNSMIANEIENTEVFKSRFSKINNIRQ